MVTPITTLWRAWICPDWWKLTGC